ncbi:hypothetical protein T06_9844 [Trichinella sp. T6]|nr:hypothetical protein T06_9844 [Trichinella sp. T6]
MYKNGPLERLKFKFHLICEGIHDKLHAIWYNHMKNDT